MQPVGRAIALVLLSVPFLALVGYEFKRNWCTNPIVSKDEAIRVVKEMGKQSAIFNFPDLGGSSGFVSKLTDPDCCSAEKEAALVGLTFEWWVSLNYPTKPPRYEAVARITRCGALTWTGTLPPD